MNRQVFRADAQLAAAGVAAPPAAAGDSFVEKLVKLIPAETIAVYLFIQGILESALTDPGQLRIWLWCILVIMVIGNGLYLRRYSDVKDPVQYIILTLAFIVWVMTIGGPFEYLSFYEPFMGSVILALFTFFATTLYKGVSPS